MGDIKGDTTSLDYSPYVEVWMQMRAVASCGQ